MNSKVKLTLVGPDITPSLKAPVFLSNGDTLEIRDDGNTIIVLELSFDHDPRPGLVPVVVECRRELRPAEPAKA